MTNMKKQRYMAELCRLTDGNISAQVSMFEVGAAIGLEKEAARRLCEDLIADGMVEIKTLSGGIGITAQGLEATAPLARAASGPDLELGKGPVLNETGRQALEVMISDIKASIHAGAKTYARLEEMVIDIKTIDVQLLSPRPKTAVITETLRSLKDAFKDAGVVDLAGRLDTMTGA